MSQGCYVTKMALAFRSRWVRISISIIDRDFGEQTAQAGENAWFRPLDSSFIPNGVLFSGRFHR
jgi:hypothetical protein